MFPEPISKLMNNTKFKILKEKTKDEEGGLAMLSRLTKLSFLPKFWILNIQATLIYYKRLILRWVLDSLNKILCFPKKVFLAIFTKEDTELQRLRDLKLTDWQTLSHPILHSDNTLSLFNYDNKIIKDALYYIKNKKDETTLELMCQIISDMLIEDLADRELFDNFRNPVLVSIPSSKTHTLKRGYNPSSIIAETISKLSSIQYISNVLLKSKHTPAQKTLSRYERLKNVKNSMSINPKNQDKIKDRCIIIVDDIMTTGATLKEAKRVLLKTGARKVMSVVLAH